MTSPAEMFRFCDVCLSGRGGPNVAAATWLHGCKKRSIKNKKNVKTRKKRGQNKKRLKTLNKKR